MKQLFFLALMATSFFACEEKPVEIPDFTIEATGRVVLVEELTGVKCPNCPAGSARLKESKALAPDNVVVVAIHGIDLASPLSQSKYDFRNEDAADLEIYLRPFLGKPAAYFNRVKFDNLNGDWGNSFHGQWPSIISEQVQKPQQLNLSIVKNYNPDERKLDIRTSVLPLETISGEFKLTIMLTESKIIDAQDDQQTVIEDYEHNFVLQEIITNFDGDFLASELIENELVVRDYSFTLPDNGDGLWNPDNMNIVAFIANTEGESEEVLQAAESSVRD